MINAQKLVRSLLIKLYLLRRMLKFKSILHFSKEKVMVSIEAFSHTIRRAIPGDIQVLKRLDVKY